MRFTRFNVLPVALTALLATPLSSQAQSNNELDQRIRVLERQLEIQKEDAEAKAKDGATVVANDKGFSIKSNKGDYELKLRALVQLDGRFYASETGTHFNDGFELRRVRPTFDGTIGKWVSFRVTPELAGASSTVLDAYFDLAFDPTFKLRAGRFKAPVGLERYFYSTAALNHVEFGLPTALLPNRDFGLQLHGDLFSSTFNYAVALINGGTDGQDSASPRNNDNRKEVAARLFAEPFKNDPGFLQGLGFGIGGTYGSKQGSATTTATLGNTLVTPSYRTPGQNNFFVYDGQSTFTAGSTVQANGEQIRWTPQAYFYRNSFGSLAEYAVSEQELSDGTNAGKVKNTAYQVSLTYVLTGEDASTKGVKPANPFKPGESGWGALEIAARTGGLEIDDDAFNLGFATAGLGVQQEARTYGIGLNWYLTQNVKTVVNYDHTEFESFAGGVDRPTEKAIFTRIQLSY